MIRGLFCSQKGECNTIRFDDKGVGGKVLASDDSVRTTVSQSLDYDVDDLSEYRNSDTAKEELIKHLQRKSEEDGRLIGVLQQNNDCIIESVDIVIWSLLGLMVFVFCGLLCSTVYGQWLKLRDRSVNEKKVLKQQEKGMRGASNALFSQESSQKVEIAVVTVEQEKKLLCDDAF